LRTNIIPGKLKFVKDGPTENAAKIVKDFKTEPAIVLQTSQTRGFAVSPAAAVPAPRCFCIAADLKLQFLLFYEKSGASFLGRAVFCFTADN